MRGNEIYLRKPEGKFDGCGEFYRSCMDTLLLDVTPLFTIYKSGEPQIYCICFEQRGMSCIDAFGAIHSERTEEPEIFNREEIEGFRHYS